MSVRNRQKQVRAYRGQIPSPGRPSVAWREDRVRFWVAIAAGAKTRDAGGAAGVSEPVAHRWFLHAGGVNPQLAPTLSGRYLSSSDREDIALWRAQDCGVREIARRLGRSPSTISRELRRNASTRTYRLDNKASTAQWHAERRARRPKTAKLITNDGLRDYVNYKLSGHVRAGGGERLGPVGPVWEGKNKPHREDREWVRGWSPQQIAKRLPVEFPDDPTMRISREAIYQALYVPSRGGLTRQQAWHLRRGRTKRTPRARTHQQAWAHVTDATTLKKRPSEEADERKVALVRTFEVLPADLRRSLTWDRGKEMSAHALLTQEIGLPIYFADAKSPWQRGSNEHLNGLLRQTSRKAPTSLAGARQRSKLSPTSATTGRAAS